MTNPFSNIDAKLTMKYLGDFNSKLMKGAELLTDIEEIDVGTAAKQLSLIHILDESGVEVEWGTGGFLVIKKPWPSMIRNIWNDPERYKQSYFPEDLGGKLYLAGDGAIRDKETGYFTIMGRIDDVLNVSGHRMGTMEIESALVANPLVAEAAVVGKPHDIKGEAIVAYVVLKGERPEGDEAKKIVAQLRDWVGKEIGPIAKPDDIRFGDNLSLIHI